MKIGGAHPSPYAEEYAKRLLNDTPETLMKMQHPNSQSSRENTTLSRGTSKLTIKLTITRKYPPPPPTRTQPYKLIQI